MAVPLQVTADATGTTLVLTISSSPSYVPASGFGGGVSNFDIQFTYPTNVASYVSGVGGAGYTVVPNGATSGTVVIAGFASDGGNGSPPGSQLARVTFLLPSTTAPRDFPVTFSNTALNDDAQMGGTADPTVACFVRGTLILTEAGEVPVERLGLGDRVRLAEGGSSAVTWLGRRRVQCGPRPRPQDVWPVRVQAGALAPDVPRRDLVLSPDHALAFEGALVPVRYLLNGATIRQEEWSEVTYFHVELERHAVLLAEGAAAESYLETGRRHEYAAAATVVALPGDAQTRHALAVWTAESCLPLLTDGPALEAVREALLARAVALGHATTAEPAPVLLADDAVVLPRRAVRTKEGRDYSFTVPAGTRQLRLVSRRFVPAFMLPDSADHRPLGLAARKLTLDGAAVRPDAGEGWYGVEGGLQWTDGAAALPSGTRSVTVSTAALGLYWIADEVAMPGRAAA